MSIVRVMSAKSAASLSVGSLRISVPFKAIFTKFETSSLQVHSFWKDEIPIFSYKLHFFRNLASTLPLMLRYKSLSAQQHQ